MILGVVLLAGLFSATAQTNDYSKIFKTDVEKNSYAIGMYFANSIKGLTTQESNSLDIKLIQKALTDTLNGSPTLITLQQNHDIVTAFQMQMRSEQAEKQRAKLKEMSETNTRVGTAFMMKNKNMPGVITLPSGMQYKIIKAGTGDKPKADDIVTVNYRGTHLDGSEFDSSFKRGKPMERAANQLIPGWTEALQLMPVGSEWQLFIPPTLAYGDRGSPPTINPGETLIFDVELLDKKAPTAGPTGQMTSDIIKVPSAEGLKHGEKIETIKASDVDKTATKTNN